MNVKSRERINFRTATPVKPIETRQSVIHGVWISHNDDRLLRELADALPQDSTLLALPQSAWNFELFSSERLSAIFQQESLQRIVLVGHSRYFKAELSTEMPGNANELVDSRRANFNRQTDWVKQRFASHFHRLVHCVGSSVIAESESQTKLLPTVTGLLYMADFGCFARYQPESESFEMLVD